MAFLEDSLPCLLLRNNSNLTARLAERGEPPGTATDSALTLLSSTVHQHATMMAYNDVFWIMGMLSVVGLPFLLMLGGRTPQAAPAPRQAVLQGATDTHR